MATAGYRRTKTLIRPASQLEVVLFILLIAWGAVLLNYILFQLYTAPVLRKVLPPAHEAILQTHLFRILFCTIGASVPVALAVGVGVTFRYFGPIYRFKLYLASIVSGELSKECKIRDGDKLQDLCESINRAAERLRADVRRDRVALRRVEDLIGDLDVYLPETERARAAALLLEIREALALQPALGPAAPSCESADRGKVVASETSEKPSAS